MAIKKAYIDIADGQIHYRCVAGDGVALIFLHRTPASSATFEQMMISMAGDRPMYALDTPGFGGSFDPPGWPSVTDYRNWLIEAIDGLNIEAFHLFGHHTGTHLATEIAASLTDRTRSLMLNGVAYLTANEREQFRGMVADAVLPDADGRYLSETWQVIRGLFAEFDPELVHREFVGAMRAMQGRDQAFAAIWDQDYPAVMAKVVCPMFVMSAEDDFFVPYMERVKETHPETRIALLGPAKVASPELGTDESVRVVREFLADVESA
ncbi:MAG: alpha/beta hydrolase [Gammaproteobacteria bacterium]|jgi:pimeloyl-ACP methyl ester carboxylesterase